jgi:hypothetical protein
MNDCPMQGVPIEGIPMQGLYPDDPAFSVVTTTLTLFPNS